MTASWSIAVRLRFFSLPFLLVALCAVAVPSRAANPKVTLQIDKATVVEAVDRLSKAAGVPLDLSGDVPKGTEQATFEWKEATFAEAMRQVCEKFLLLPQRGQNGGYV